jgi:uncharacterized protein YcbX
VRIAATVSRLAIHPVKSCAAIEVQEAAVGATGFELDRRWMVVGEDGGFLSQRSHPSLALVRVAVDGERLLLKAPAIELLELPLAASDGPAVKVTVWHDECPAIDEGEAAASWFSRHLGMSARLVRIADDAARPLHSPSAQPGDTVSFADGFPFLLLSEASLDDLNHRLPLPVPMNRFRANIVVAGCGPYAEDGWQRLSIGGVVFRVVKPCARCVVITVDQASGERGREPLRTLSTYRSVDGQVLFGQNLVHEGRGVIRIGDKVEVLAKEWPE